MTLTLDVLRAGMEAGIDGIRARFELDSLAVPGGAVARPTYGTENSAATKYVLETHQIDEKDVSCASPDAAVSQPDAIELSLLRTVRSDRALATKRAWMSMAMGRSEDLGAVVAGGCGR